jgi:hypothetical protein
MLKPGFLQANTNKFHGRKEAAKELARREEIGHQQESRIESAFFEIH